MALCVSPPPQGFSHARCSSKRFTLCPARASCSPHIAPEGPPPMIAISAMIVSDRVPRFFLPTRKRTLKNCYDDGQLPLGDGENHQAKTSQEYSTEYRCCRSRTCFLSHKIHPPPLQQVQQHEIGEEQDHQDFSAVQVHEIGRASCRERGKSRVG